MCIEDIRIGRKTSVAVREVTLVAGAAAVQIVEHNVQRIHLTFLSGNLAGASIAPQPITPSATNGFQIFHGLDGLAAATVQDPYPIEFDIQEHGLAVTLPWQGFALAAGNSVLTIIEVILNMD